MRSAYPQAGLAVILLAGRILAKIVCLGAYSVNVRRAIVRGQRLRRTVTIERQRVHIETEESQDVFGRRACVLRRRAVRRIRRLRGRRGWLWQDKPMPY